MSAHNPTCWLWKSSTDYSKSILKALNELTHRDEIDILDQKYGEDCKNPTLLPSLS